LSIKDGDVLSLIRKFLVSGVMVENTFEETTVGTPQGGNLSPLLSNIMLNELDKELESRGLKFVRYADDCNIFVRSEKAANRVMESITRFIEKKLGLIVNASKSKVGRPNEIKFLGFGYYYDRSSKSYKVIPHKASIDRLKRKLKKLTSRKWSISLDKLLKLIKQAVTGWIYYYRIAKMTTVLKNIDMKLRMRIRVVIWKQWKKTLRRYLALRKLGVNHDNAYMTANCRKGYQYVCHTATIHTTITNQRLEKRGLISLLNLYKKVHLDLSVVI